MTGRTLWTIIYSMTMEGKIKVEATRSRRGEAIQLGTLAFLTLLTALFALAAIMVIAEALGPSTTRTGIVLERSSFEWKGQTCSWGNRSTSPCREYITPAGAVTGEFPNGETWIVVADESGTSPKDVAGRPGSEIAVTTSKITNRVTKLDNGSRFESTWTRWKTLESVVVVVFGIGLIIALALIIGLRRRRSQTFGQLPRLLVVGSFAAALAIGVFGTWWGTIKAVDQYRAPSSSAFYGSFVAETYGFDMNDETAEDAGTAVELPRNYKVIRSLKRSDLTTDVRSAIDAEDLAVIALIAELSPSGNGLLALRLFTDGDNGEVVEASPCDSYEFPTEVGIDPEIVAGIFCLPADIDPMATIRVGVGPNDAGTPINATLVN